MGPEVVNRIKDSEFHGNYAGRDLNVTNIIMLEDSEREFVVTHNANIKPVAYFTGREKELENLRQRIEEGRKSVLVSGMGGIGKTHICRKLFEEYLNKHAEDENGPFRNIGYIEYDGDMGSSLQRCLKYKEQDSPEKNREAVWKELEYLSSDGKLLLLVDNVDKPISADLGLQRLKGIPGAIVLTSRQASICDEFEPYPIGFLDTEQCKEIYEKIRFRGSGRKVDLEEVPDLEYVIETLAGRHTITVEHLAHLAWIKTWTVKGLREELEQKGFCIAFRKDGEFVNIQKSYEVLYDLSELTEAEQNILEAFSVFPYIPLAATTCNQWLLLDAGVSEDDDILMGLYQKGWLQFDMDQESYSMHPVFAQFIYEKCKPEYERHHGLIETCQNSLKVPENGSVLECQSYIPFAENMVVNFYNEKNEVQHSLMNELGCLLFYMTDYKEAEKKFKQCIEVCLNDLGESHPVTATSYNNLASVYERKGEYKKAKEFCEKSLRINVKVLGENHPSTATNYHNLAMVYEGLEEYKKAEEFYEKSLRIKIKELGEKHSEIATGFNNLAVVYGKRGEYKKAEKLYQKGLSISKKALGENNPFTAANYNNLACMYKDQGEYEKAEDLIKKSLEIHKKELGENHLTTAMSYNNLASVYENQGEYEKAEDLIKKSLEISKRILGMEHLFTATNYNNLAIVYKEQGAYEKALSYYFKAYRIEFTKLERGHLHAQIVYENMELAFKEWNPEGNFEQWLEEKMKESHMD